MNKLLDRTTTPDSSAPGSDRARVLAGLTVLLPRRSSSARYVDSRSRLWVLLALYATAAFTLFARLCVLEATDGAAHRKLATQPRQSIETVPGLRGRIFSRDGQVLALDESVVALAVHYRYLQDPPDADWLRRQARSRLSRSQRRDVQRVNEEVNRLRVEILDLHRRLAHECGLTFDVWRSRAARVERQVERIAESVNRRHRERYEQDLELAAQASAEQDHSGWDSLVSLLPGFGEEETASRPRSLARIVVAEERDYHILVERVSPELATEIESEPEKFPGITTLRQTVRSYPQHDRAAHLLGYVRQDPERAEPRDLRGATGLEKTLDARLSGTPGTVVENTAADGQLLSTFVQQPATRGRDVELTIDLRLQHLAEQLLDEALGRAEALEEKHTAEHGGAAVLLDVETGEVLALATAPRFDPNWFTTGPSTLAAAALEDPAQPLFDRATRMSVPPGSVFKLISAAALLDRGVIDPREPVHCQGYYRQMDRERCALFQLTGRGHGSLDLVDALAVSCNVFFYRCADTLGERDLLDWARRFGLGTRTGIELDGESPGNLPAVAGEHTDRNLIIGQGQITTTPLQMARATAAIANGGTLPVPTILRSHNDKARTGPLAVRGFTTETQDWLHRGMVAVVADSQGTAHRTVFSETIEIAGKTGTAETGPDEVPHAWFVGYAPAEQPRLAVAVCLEHAGAGGGMAGPVAKHLLLAADRLGYLGTAEQQSP